MTRDEFEALKLCCSFATHYDDYVSALLELNAQPLSSALFAAEPKLSHTLINLPCDPMVLSSETKIKLRLEGRASSLYARDMPPKNQIRLELSLAFVAGTIVEP
ncbi:uncharacterized protein FOMMEDRAFT_152826 [Fomitiporia mediterranea MF3/22]|uniref:uncharacterized protein n=1 Tax=Fomitiporia mediterranea (strain MF3/22) TaxID=694068 RepID=UPI0004407CF3|nr:uncharacterized protein FOMMEDRAFT_152826 [Fomitiporia mediterranea MF3/22]EJD05506.1 hypothetical protein FOMMEDRAFT_152826 [Fomitiporia mediterranea MF3/22]